jgi:cyclopropane-fatty-acyl-phospholipid synthase
MTAGLARRLFLGRLAGLAGARLEVRDAVGSRFFGEEEATLQARVDIRDDRAYSRFVLGGDVAFGETYTDGLWTTPDLYALARVGVRNAALFETGSSLLAALSRFAQRARHRRRPNSLAGSRRNIEAHYDLGNELYALFLDSHMAYSCAFYERPEATLEEAQEAKFERICEKLRIGASDHVLEIGTGWGGFAIWAARRRGCRVTTATISRAQHDVARERIARAGLSDRVTLLYEDYRRLSGTFDRIVSIEMFEAVGLERYDEFFGAAERLLTPRGAMLLQTITINEQRFPDYRKQPDWIQLHVFPGSELACLSEILRSIGRRTRLTLIQLEDLAPHYVRTLLSWRERFLANRERVRALGFDERFVRLWDYYLASCAAGFAERYLGDAQLLFVKHPSCEPQWGDPALPEMPVAVSLAPRSGSRT